jgi:hypothetical protein
MGILKAAPVILLLLQPIAFFVRLVVLAANCLLEKNTPVRGIPFSS